MEPHRPQFSTQPGPSGPAGIEALTQILRAGNFLPSSRGNPRNGGSRGRAAWRREALPNRRLRPPPGAFLVTFWASKKSLAAGAAKLPCKERNFSIIAPSSVTASPCHLPPRGKALRGRPPGHLSPMGRLTGGHMGPPLQNRRNRRKICVGAGPRPAHTKLWIHQFIRCDMKEFRKCF